MNGVRGDGPPPIVDDPQPAARLALPIVGAPLTSPTHGGLGWSTIGVAWTREHICLLDVGGPGYRRLLLERLANWDIGPEDITDVALTHLHWDHVHNVTAFPAARIHVGTTELRWATADRGTDPFTAELHARYLSSLGTRLHELEPGDAVVPGICAIALDGHTPGHLGFVVDTLPHPTVFVGDAIKNLTEYTSGQFCDSADPEASAASLYRVAELSRPDPIRVIFGHADPVVLHAGRTLHDVDPGPDQLPTIAWLDPSDDQWHQVLLASHNRSLYPSRRQPPWLTPPS